MKKILALTAVGVLLVLFSLTLGLADSTISNLPDGGSDLTRNSIVPVVNSGVTKRATVGQITDIPPPYISSKAKADVLINTFNAASVAYWLFDASGSGTTVTDKIGFTSASVTPHTITLRDASLNAKSASYFYPGLIGPAPTMSFSTNLLWDASDNDDLSLIASGNDAKSMVMALVKFTSVINSTIAAKWTDTSAEWYFGTDPTGKLQALFYDSSANAQIGRSYSVPLSTNTWYMLAFYYDGTGSATDISLYINGVKIDDTTITTGSYVKMRNGTAKAGNYITTAGAVSQPGQYTIGALTVQKSAAVNYSIYIKNYDMAFRGYMGIF